MTMITEDKTLVKVREQVERKLPTELKKGYRQIVDAGMALLFSDQTHQYMQQAVAEIQKQGNQPQHLANAMINLILVIAREAHGQMSLEAAFPAAVTLMTHVLQYMHVRYRLPITEDVVKAIGQQMAPKFIQAVKSQMQVNSTSTHPTTGLLQQSTPQPQGA